MAGPAASRIAPVSPHQGPARPRAAWAAWLALSLFAGGCGTVDLGDNFVAPDLRLDEDYFYCVIQPMLNDQGCSMGMAGETGCHGTATSLHLEVSPAVPCDGEMVVGPIPDEAQRNFEAIRFTVQGDPASSPLYLRPTGMESHPARGGNAGLFPTTDPAALAIEEWITRGGM